MKTGFSSTSNLYLRIVKVSIYDFFSYICIILRKNKNDLYIFKGFKKSLYCIVKNRPVVEQQKLLWDRTTHSGADTTCHYNCIFFHSVTDNVEDAKSRYIDLCMISVIMCCPEN